MEAKLNKLEGKNDAVICGELNAGKEEARVRRAEEIFHNSATIKATLT